MLNWVIFPHEGWEDFLEKAGVYRSFVRVEASKYVSAAASGGNRKDIRNAVDSLREALFDNGGFVLQMEAGPGANPCNVIEDMRRNVELNP